MRKIIIYSAFAVAIVVVILLFITSKNYTQLALASLAYLPLALFGWGLMLRNHKKRLVKPVVIEEPREISQGGVPNIDRREFLRLIGVAGVSFFIYSIFAKRAEALFFGRAAEPGVTLLSDSLGKKIDPAERQPTDGYQISEIEDSETPYYGFVNKSGGWYIMKVDSETGSFRYSSGETGFADNWARRSHLKYGYFHDVFGR